MFLLNVRVFSSTQKWLKAAMLISYENTGRRVTIINLLNVQVQLLKK